MSCKALTLAIFASSATAFSSLALAQATKTSAPAPASAASAPTSGNKGEEQAIRWFKMLDTNKDGRLSQEETAWLTRFKPSLAEEFKAADANHDGYVTQDEIRALADRRRVERAALREKEQSHQNKETPSVSTQ